MNVILTAVLFGGAGTCQTAIVGHGAYQVQAVQAYHNQVYHNAIVYRPVDFEYKLKDGEKAELLYQNRLLVESLTKQLDEKRSASTKEVLREELKAPETKDQDGRAILQAECMKCHGPGKSAVGEYAMSFTKDGKLSPANAALISEVLEKGSMPPGKPLSEDKLKKVAEYLEHSSSKADLKAQAKAEAAAK